MKVSLELDDLLNLLTYNKLFSNISLVNFPHIASVFKEADPENSTCYVDLSQDNHPILWTREGWNSEQLRLKRMGELEAEAAKQKEERAANPLSGMTADKKELYREMRAAIQAGDFKKVMELKIRLK